MTRSLLLASALVLAACSSSHIASYTPKHRRFDPGAYDTTAPSQGASLWAAGNAGLFSDDRARRIGDILIVRIDESDQASRDDSTTLDRSSKQELGMPSPGVFAKLAARFPSVDPATLLSTESEQSFAGGGRIQKKGRVQATLPVRVREVMPNGDLFVEGTKVVKVGGEEQHLYLSGVVRASDVGPDDTVRSSRIADAEIEIIGRGDITAQQRPGWFTRLVSKINPF